MLSKPGEARRTSSGSTPSSRRQKKVDEGNPDDVVRKIQRLPANKACADCSSKVWLVVYMLLICIVLVGAHHVHVQWYLLVVSSSNIFTLLHIHAITYTAYNNCKSYPRDICLYGLFRSAVSLDIIIIHLLFHCSKNLIFMHVHLLIQSLWTVENLTIKSRA